MKKNMRFDELMILDPSFFDVLSGGVTQTLKAKDYKDPLIVMYEVEYGTDDICENSQSNV